MYLIPTYQYGSKKKIVVGAAYLGKQVTSNIWHNRLGHPSNPIVSQMLKKSNVSFVADTIPILCHRFLEGKFTKLPFNNDVSKYVSPFEIVHSDVWGPAPCVSIEGFKYYVTFIDECTRYCWIFPIINKNEVCSTFISFYKSTLNQFNVSIKVLQRDGGREYIGNQFKTLLLDKSISHHLSCPYTPEQNGLAE